MTSTLRRALSLTVTAGAAAAVWGIGIERHLYVLRQHTVAILPPGTDPIRVLHLSDIHMAPWQSRKQAWLSSLAALRPDFIVNTGDNLGHPDALRGVRAAFAGLAGIPGVFVSGSNDHFAPKPRNPLKYFAGPSKRPPKDEPLDNAALQRFFTEQLGWASLDNASASFEVRGHHIEALGLNDAHVGWDDIDALPSMTQSLAEEESDLPRIRFAVTHAPYQNLLNAFVDSDADMLFAGHTHGGQVRLPGFGALVANCDIPLKQSRGLSSWKHEGRTVPLNVSAGIGHSIYSPVRFACRPEASLITLVPREA